MAGRGPIPALVAEPLRSAAHRLGKAVETNALGRASPALGLGLRVIVAFERAGTAAEPWHPTTALVTTGLYARIRNPMYVALVLLLTGIGLLSGGAWLLLLVPVLGAVLHLGVVRPEERYLAGRFGDAYRAYRSRAPRYGWPGPLAGRGPD